jgi:hypothetical protein
MVISEYYEYGQLPSLNPIGTHHTETFTHTAGLAEIF